jgi:hypothetical protein
MGPSGSPTTYTGDCLAKVTARNNAQADVDAAQCEINSSYQTNLTTWTTKRKNLQDAFDAQKAIFSNLLDATSISQNSQGPLDSYVDTLEDEYKTLEEERYTLQQSIRAGRRRFLDDDPQRKVANVLGLQTTDDKILLAYWICFLFGLTAIYTLVLVMYGDALNLQTGQQKVGVYFVLILLSAGISYYFIYKYA